jgi:hypothetical protein
MAKEVEQVNASTFFSTSMFFNAKTRQAELVRKRLGVLPGIMRVYAAGLENHIARVPDLTVKSYPSSSDAQARWLVLLSYVVKLATGKWMDKEVAELLNATAIALGERREFDALTVTQHRSRWKKREVTVTRSKT